MSDRTVWYASPDSAPHDPNVTRTATGPAETLRMLTDATKWNRSGLLVYVDQPAVLFADATYRARLLNLAHDLVRQGRRSSGVTLELQW
jgi:hypothetical protein